jgi:NADH-quinone oxidoreductase subunit C
MSEILDKITARFGAAVRETHSFRGDDTALVDAGSLIELAGFLKGDPDLDFNILMDLTAVDCSGLDKPYRFEVVYHFYSLAKNHRVRVKVPLDEERPEAPTLTGLWPIANWFEREVWDLFGIRFTGHPDLRRILMYEEFTGHPLRKDYPVNQRQPLVKQRPI